MSSPERERNGAHDVEDAVRPGAREGSVGPILDSVFGLFVWMAHLLVIYIAVAVSCGFGLVRAGMRDGAGLVAFLLIVTAAASLLVGFHAWRRWQRHRVRPQHQFRMSVTIGCDAIAAVGILWQFLAIGMIPPCR